VRELLSEDVSDDGQEKIKVRDILPSVLVCILVPEVSIVNREAIKNPKSSRHHQASKIEQLWSYFTSFRLSLKGMPKSCRQLELGTIIIFSYSDI
jgi:hypothetical protein